MRHRSNPLLRLVPFLWTALAATAPVAPAQEAPRTASNGWHAHLAGRGLLLLPAAAPAGRSPWCPGLAFYDLCTGELLGALPGNELSGLAELVIQGRLALREALELAPRFLELPPVHAPRGCACGALLADALRPGLFRLERGVPWLRPEERRAPDPRVAFGLPDLTRLHVLGAARRGAAALSPAARDHDDWLDLISALLASTAALIQAEPPAGGAVPLPPSIESDLPRSCLLYTSPSPRDQRGSRMPSSA